MATSQQFLVSDNSTLTNFKAWAQAISAFIASAGWLQSTDTGQVNWSTIVAVPGVGAFVFELWQPNDGLTNFFLKIEYGNVSSSANFPTVRLTTSTGTNGAGTPTGFVVGPFIPPNGTIGTPSPTATFECNFFGAPGVLGIMLWRTNAAGVSSQIFCVERSLNSGGSYTNTYVTLWTLGTQASGANFNQQSLHLAAGPAPLLTIPNSVRGVGTAVSSAFAGTLAVDLSAPFVGLWDSPCTVIASAAAADMAEGVTFTGTVNGILNTYIPSKITIAFNRFGPGNQPNFAVCVRTA